ncbi:MAG: anaerobic ribonucleoside-triphosphate reductase activating protein [Bacteroidales bacterium]|nr:anaerobic ribonucleoside-triphosphate reductase activating protein [Bacteroidales bacterium]
MLKASTLRVIRIVDGTSVDGPGLRTSLYLAGCAHECPGCHNPQSWPFDAGEDWPIDELIDRVEENDFDVTLSGGDPLYQIDGVVELCRRIKEQERVYPNGTTEHGRNIWLYTGFTYEQVKASPSLSRVLPYIDVIVDGPFVEALKDRDLLFRGSSNQRIIEVASGATL